MSFENNNFKVVKKIALPKSEFNVACTISADGEIAKVFAVSHEAYVDNQEITNGVVSFSGHVDVCMIYQLETGEIGSAFSSCPFSSRFEDDSIQSGEKAIINLNVIDHSIDAISGNEASLGLVVEQSGILVENIDINSIAFNDEDVCVKEDEVSIVRFVGSGNASASESMSYTSRDKVKKVLGSEVCIVVRSTEAGSNFVSVGGDVITKVLFVDENDKFNNIQIVDSFKEEIEIEGVSRDSVVEAVANVNSSGIRIEVEEEANGSKIVAQVPFDILALAFEETSVNMISDLYSTKNEMEISSQTFTMSKTLNMEFVEGKVDGSLTIDDSQPRVDKILFTFGSSAQVTGTSVEDGEITIEGLAKTTVVYLNDEQSSFNAVEIEVPFAITDKTKATEQSLLLTNAILTDVDVVVKKGRELFFDGKIKAIVTISSDEVSAVISSAKEGEPLAERDYAMQLVFAKQGDSLWDIAKMNRVKESMIASQNPNVVFPLQENKDIIIFYQNV